MKVGDWLVVSDEIQCPYCNETMMMDARAIGEWKRQTWSTGKCFKCDKPFVVKISFPVDPVWEVRRIEGQSMDDVA